MLEYYVQLPRTAAMDARPYSIEFALMDKCKALADSPVERTVTYEEFLAILPELHKRWHKSAKTQLVKAVQKVLRRRSVWIPTDDPLKLAVVVFVCVHCYPFTCMRYPAVLAHSCGYTSYDSDSDKQGCDDIYTHTAQRLHVVDCTEPDARERFSLKNLVGPQDSYICEVLEPMCTIVRALGLDPTTATAADLDACDARLRCSKCVANGSPDAIYSWDAAVSLHRPHWPLRRVPARVC